MTRTRSLYASAIVAAALAVSLLAGATAPLLGSTLDGGLDAPGAAANGPIGLAGRGAGCDACDVNCDGAVDGRDIQAFAAALLGAPSAGCSPCAGDVDGSGGVTVADFGGLVDCLLVANQAFVQGGCLHVIGSDAAGSLALRLRAGLPTMLDVDFGNDGVVEFSFDRSQFDCIEVEGRGGDDVIVIDEQNGVFTDTEITTIDGGSGNDLLFGGSGGETFIGGPGNDSAFMGAGNDRFIWNPGDDTDLVEGADGIDTVEVNGSDGSEDFTITANGTRVRLDRVSPAAFFLDIGTCENLLLNAHGGNDTLSCVGNLAALVQITADGGPGNDTLLGSNGADVLIGGDDNDFIDGNQGNDTVLLGAGNDTFQWDPGDGSDIVEGQGGQDVVVFNGSNANENMAFSANGSRLRFTRDVGNIVMDIAGVEQFDLRALGGTDNVTASNLSGTGVTQVNVDLGATGGVGDAQADNVTIVGTAGADAFNVFASSGFTVVNVGADIRVKGYEFGDQLVFNGVGGDVVSVNGSSGADTMTVVANGTQARVDATGYSAGVAVSGALSLVVNGLGGPDNISCTGNLAGLLIPLTLDGGPGDDVILGSNGADVLIGGDDNDFVDGNQGNDTALLGAGNDTFQWDPGDGSDIVEGQGDHDVVVFNGSNANENMAFSANGSRLRFTRDVGNIVMDIAGVEQFDLRALGGTDNVTASNLSGTGVTQVNVDLGATGGVGDAQADNVTIVGTAGADAFNVFASSGFTVVNVGADIRVKGYEFGDQLVFNGVGGDVVSVNGSSGADTMTVVANGTQARVDATGYSAGVAVSGALSLVVNGLGGPDNISCTGNLAGLLIPLTLDGGPGDDVILGSNGADVLIGGDDNDFVDGNQGNDTALLGPGDDTFNWDPGDGSDTIEGQDGHDVLLFNGSNASEIMDLSANGQRLRLTRNVGNIVMDTNDVEQINLQALGGVDAVTTNDLSATGVTLVNIDLGATGGVGDAQPDTVTVNGTNLPDTILVGANAGAVEVSGLAAFVRITHPEAANDTLIVNGLGGADTITPGPGVTALIMLTVNP